MMTEKEKLDLFLELSVALTAYKKVDLLGTGLAFQYYESVLDRVGDENSNQLLEIYNEILNLDEKDTEDLIRRQIMSNPQLGPMARAIIKLWYLGQWDALPPSWRAAYGNYKNDVNEIISAESYKEGLVWSAIGAHPMGAKQTGFDSWSDPPKSTEENA